MEAARSSRRLETGRQYARVEAAIRRRSFDRGGQERSFNARVKA